MWVGFAAFGQQELSNFTATGRAGLSTTLATDYQSQGINPANLALEPTYDGMHQTFGLGELGFSVYSDAISKFNLGSALWDPNRRLTNTEKAQAASDFAGRGITVNLDFLYGGYAWQKVSGGSGFCLAVRERAQWYSKFNGMAADILFKGLSSNYFDSLAIQSIYDSASNGYTFDTLGAIATIPQTLSQILNGTRISMSWVREYALGYGVNVVNSFDFKLNLGVGAKYIQGIGYMDLQSDGKTLTAFIAASPWFGIKFFEQKADTTTDSTRVINTGSNLGFLPNSAGQGVGFEIGLTAVYKDRYRFSVAATDIGSVNYETNVYEASDTLLTNISNRGFYNYNFFQNASQFDGFQRDLIRWKGLQNRIQPLPTKLRMGAAIVKEKWSAGVETVIPLNDAAGNFVKPIWSVGGEYTVGSWLKLGTGLVFGGNYGSTVLMPMGITCIVSNGMWELGIASRDVITYVKAQNPMLSLATGLMRFRF